MSRGKQSTAKSVSGDAGVRVSPDYASRYSDAAALATECVLNAVRLGDQLLTSVGQVWREHQLSVSAGNALMIVVGAGEPIPPHVVGERLLVTRAAVTGLVDVLESHGLVRRQPHERDRRMLLVAATPTGRELASIVQPNIVRLELELLACLSAEEQATFIELASRLQASITLWRASHR